MDSFASEAEVSGYCEAIRQWFAPKAIVFAPAPMHHADWQCDHTGSTGSLVRAEVANRGDFGYTISAVDGADSVEVRMLLWRHGVGGRWEVETTMTTRHPSTSPEVNKALYEGLGWVRATRLLYQEAARVAMLKADRDMATASVDAGSAQAYTNLLADSVLYLVAGLPILHERNTVLDYLVGLESVVGWVPVGGEIAAAGDLGYTYGLQTRRVDDALAPESSAYLRIWRARPDSTWHVVVSIGAGES